MPKAIQSLSGHQALGAAPDHRGSGGAYEPGEEGPGKKAGCKGEAGRDQACIKSHDDTCTYTAVCSGQTSRTTLLSDFFPQQAYSPFRILCKVIFF